jgi:hypothetical protein
MMCFGTARNPDHPTCDCPILRNLGFKLEKRTGSDSAARDAASRVATDDGASAGPAPAPAPAAPVDTQPGSASSPPGAFSASSEPASYDSGDEFDYEGKADGAMYGIGGKSNASSVYSTPSCCNVVFEPESGSAPASDTASPSTTDIPMGG